MAGGTTRRPNRAEPRTGLDGYRAWHPAASPADHREAPCRHNQPPGDRGTQLPAHRARETLVGHEPQKGGRRELAGLLAPAPEGPGGRRGGSRPGWRVVSALPAVATSAG